MSESARWGSDDAHPDAGFTLVELLAALALLSLVSMILLTSLRFGLRAWERGSAGADDIDTVGLVQSFLRRAIEDAYPFYHAAAGTPGHVDFEGTAHSLQILSLAPHALRGGGRSLVSLTIAPGRHGLDLAVTVAPELANGTGGTATRVLIANVASVELAYFGKRRGDREAAWHNQWTGERQLPQLVRIEVAFPPGDTRTWPSFVVAPRIGADVACDYDPLTKRCRGR